MAKETIKQRLQKMSDDQLLLALVGLGKCEDSTNEPYINEMKKGMAKKTRNSKNIDARFTKSVKDLRPHIEAECARRGLEIA